MALRTDDETDKKYNPYEKVSGGLSDQEHAALAGLEDNYTNSADPSDENKNILKSLQNKEGAAGTWANNKSIQFTPPTKLGFIGKFTGNKKGPIAFIASLMIGAAAMMGILIVPGIGIVQMKEVMVGDLNDQLAAVTKRSDRVLIAKLSSLGSDSIGCTTGIRCKFSTFSSKQVARFESAGFKVECKGGCKTGVLARNKITGLTHTDSNGVVTRYTNPRTLQSALISNESLKTSLRRAFNPKYEAFADKTFRKVLANLKASKAAVLKSGTTDEEKAKALDAATAGEDVDTRAVTGTPVDDDPDGANKNITTAAGDEEVDARAVDRANNFVEAAKESGGAKATSKLARGAAGSLKGIGVLGIADSACSLYNSIRAVSAAAKTARALQLAQFAMVFLTTADAIKAGDATPDQVSYLGEMLNKTDAAKQVYNEFSGDGALVDNPDYGKSAFDSAGYKIAAYNEAPTLSSRSQQYLVGGGVTGTLSGVLANVRKFVGDNPEKDCKFVQNWFVRGASMAAGIAASIGSFGVWTGIGIAGSAVFAFAQPFIEAMLIDIIAGNVITDDTVGIEAGDAIFVGSSVVMGQTAQARGMVPATEETLYTYATTQAEVAAEDMKYEQALAAETPFDVMNQYSFLGSLTRSFATMSSQSTLSLSSVANIVTGGFSSLTNSTKAIVNYNPDRFTKCTDEEYLELGITADVFCNVRYVLPEDSMNVDTLETIDFMVDRGHVSDATGQAISDKYHSWLENCPERDAAWGMSTEGEDGGVTDGSECITPGVYTADELKYFRSYTIDVSINDAMDEEDTVDESVSETGGTVTSGGSSNITLVEGSRSELFDMIKNSKVKDTSGNIASQSQTIKNEILQVLASLANAGNAFTVSSFVRTYNTVSGDYVSLHVTGEAFDISARSGINGKVVTSYSDYNQTYQDFLDQIIATLKPFGKDCQIGVPNKQYEAYAEKTSECNVFVDIGSGVHFHIGAGRPY